MNATERAAEIGREHGVRDAETWLAGADLPTMRIMVERNGLEWACQGEPEPDLSGAIPGLWALADKKPTPYLALEGAYVAAYRTAVEETIREEVGR